MGIYIQTEYLMQDCNFCGEQVLFIGQTKIDMNKVEIKKQSMTLCMDCFKKFQYIIKRDIETIEKEYKN